MTSTETTATAFSETVPENTAPQSFSSQDATILTGIFVCILFGFIISFVILARIKDKGRSKIYDK